MSNSDSDHQELEAKHNKDPQNKRQRMLFSNAIALTVGILLGIIGTSLIYNSNIIRENPAISDGKYVFGIDVSHYQNEINWDKVSTSKHPIKFVFIRSTMGDDRKDKKFSRNWNESKRIGLIRGAYHYYDPNESSDKQAQNFIETVKLEKGDLPPVLDIEASSKFGWENLNKGLHNWLDIVEKHYGMKPIIYSTRGYYNSRIRKDFKDYPGWVASYTSKNKIQNVKWDFHQFSDKVRVNGISVSVDGNDFNGELTVLKKMCLK